MPQMNLVELSTLKQILVFVFAKQIEIIENSPPTNENDFKKIIYLEKLTPLYLRHLNPRFRPFYWPA